MAEIAVEAIGNDTYLVTVRDAASSTTHEVSVGPTEVEELGGDVPPETLIEASFRFLLDREPKESILRRFALNVITRYFPEYPARIGDYL